MNNVLCENMILTCPFVYRHRYLRISVARLLFNKICPVSDVIVIIWLSSRRTKHNTRSLENIFLACAE